MPTIFDATDRRILEELQQDGRLQNIELASKVGLSPSPCLRRVRRLEDIGVIERYAAILDPIKLGLNLEVFVRVSLITQDAENIEQFTKAIRSLPQVVECFVMAGECDALLRVVAANLDDYRHFQIKHLNRSTGIQNVKTDIPLQKLKTSRSLPL
jgi:Lrp/AsnC family transcriptional regulator, leucine-responsive regulatory protein